MFTISLGGPSECNPGRDPVGETFISPPSACCPGQKVNFDLIPQRSLVADTRDRFITNLDQALPPGKLSQIGSIYNGKYTCHREISHSVIGDGCLLYLRYKSYTIKIIKSGMFHLISTDS